MAEMNTGQAIDAAFDIIEKTYLEIEALFKLFNKHVGASDEFSNYTLKLQHASGGRKTIISDSLIYVLKENNQDDCDRYLAFAVLFSNCEYKVTNVDGPELWLIHCQIERENETRPMGEIASDAILFCFNKDEYHHFLDDQSPQVDGGIYRSKWISKEDPSWKERCTSIGVPLVDVTDEETLVIKMVRPLINALE